MDDQLASDADTDELLSNADLLCSGGESENKRPMDVSNQPLQRTPIKLPIVSKGETSTSSNSIDRHRLEQSIRRSLNFESPRKRDWSPSTPKRTPTNRRISAGDRDRSQSYPTTPKADRSIVHHATSDRSKSRPMAELSTKIISDQDQRSIGGQSSEMHKPIIDQIRPTTIDRPAQIDDDQINRFFDSISSFNAHRPIDDNRLPPSIDQAVFNPAGDHSSSVPGDDHSSSNSSDQSIISEKQLQSIKSILHESKCELVNVARLVDRSMNAAQLISSKSTGEQSTSDSSGSSLGLSISAEERSLLDRSSQQELRDLYEGEFYKRAYCEKKIDILQKRLLDLEEKLSISSVAIDRYKTVIGDLETPFDAFLTDLINQERRRLYELSESEKLIERLKFGLNRTIDYGRLVSEKLDRSHERAEVLEKACNEKSIDVQKLSAENSQLRSELNEKSIESENLRRKFDQAQMKLKKSYENEERSAKEFLQLEKSNREQSDVIKKLKSDLEHEKSDTKFALDEREKQFREKLRETTMENEKKMEKLKREFEQRTSGEMKKLKDEWDTVLFGLSQKYAKVVNERDEALKRLKDYEDTFADRQRVMCYELQQRLSAKYYELLTEFSAPPGCQQSSNNTTPTDGGNQTGNPNDPPPIDYHHSQGGATMDPSSWLSSSLADEFFDRLKNGSYPPGVTPRHMARSEEGGQNKVTSTPASSKQQRACPSDSKKS